ncbi:peptidase, partial [Burkholderia multivorans]
MQLNKAVAACGVAFLLSACGGVQNLDANGLTSAGTNLFKAATLSDADIAALSNDACKASDAESKIAAPNSA